MAQTMNAASMSRVNRRFLFLALILAALSAVLVYTALSRSSDPEGGGPIGSTVPVVVAKAAIPAGATITGEMVEVQQIPQSAVAALAFSSSDSAVGEVARYPIAANEQVLLSKVVSGAGQASNEVLRNILTGGQRGMAIQMAAVIGAGGLVLPGDYVDVFWVPSDPEEDVSGAQLIAEDVEVVAVEQTIIDIPAAAPGLLEDGEAPASASDDARVTSTEEAPLPEAVTVTLMISPEEVQRIFCSEQTGDLRLAVRAFGDHAPSGLDVVECIILGEGEDA